MKGAEGTRWEGATDCYDATDAQAGASSLDAQILEQGYCFTPSADPSCIPDLAEGVFMSRTYKAGAGGMAWAYKLQKGIAPVGGFATAGAAKNAYVQASDIADCSQLDAATSQAITMVDGVWKYSVGGQALQGSFGSAAEAISAAAAASTAR